MEKHSGALSSAQKEKLNERIMLRKIILSFSAAALSVLCASGKTPGKIVYSLPSTTVSMEVEAVREAFHAGPYAEYAMKYLGVEARLEDKTTYTVTGIRLVPYVEADPTAVYEINTGASSVTSADFLKLSSQGLVSLPGGFSERPEIWRFPSQSPAGGFAGAASGNNFAVLYLPTSAPDTWAPYQLSGDPAWGDAYCSGSYEGFPNVTSLLVDTPVEFYSIDVTLTSYVYESLVNGDAVIGRVDPDDPTSDFKNIYNTNGAFYVLRIYELDSAGEWTDNYEDVVLAQNIDGEVSGLIENADQWLTVDISGLNSDGESAGLGFSIISSFPNDYGMTAPAYVAIDNVVFNVPEPSECAVLAGALVLAFVYLRRRFAR